LPYDEIEFTDQPRPWEGAPGAEPLNAANLAHIQTQYAQAMADGNATFASQRIMRPNGPRLGVIGDSLQAYDNSSVSASRIATGGGVIMRQVEWLSGGRVKMTNPAQDPGDTIADGIGTQLPAILAASPLPNACLVALGRNDLTDPDAIVIGYETICAALAAAGVVPLVASLLPTDLTGALNTSNQQHLFKANALLRRFADEHGYPFVDQYPSVLDVAGGISAAYQNGTDATHLSAAGYRAVADRLIADGFLNLFPPARAITVRHTSHPYDVLAGAGLFNVAAPTGFSVAGVGSSVAYETAPVDADGLAGKWAKVTRVSGSTATGAFRVTKDAAITALRTYRFSGKLCLDGDWTGEEAARYVDLSLEWRAAGATISGQQKTLMRRLGRSGSIMTFSEDMVAPATADGFRLVAFLSGTATVDEHLYAGEWSVLDLTAAGLA